eukprot:1116629_1
MSTMLLLFCYLHSAMAACPNNDLFVLCQNEGWEGTTCSSPTDTVVAYGQNSTWAYTMVAGGIDLTCDDVAFGDPLPTQRKQCCKLQHNLAGASSLSPVVNMISCGETITDFFKSYAAVPHYWKFHLHLNRTVSISNCHTTFDTELFLRDSSGQRLSATSTLCYGWNEQMNDLWLESGDYYIEILAASSITEGIYDLSLTCGPTSTNTTASKRRCNGPYSLTKWCYDIDVYPLIATETSHTITIANEDDNSDTWFTVSSTIHDNDCVNPSIRFTFEEIDFSHYAEYLNLYDNDTSLITKCRGTKDDECGSWIDCFVIPQPLKVDKITRGDTYSIHIEEPAAVDARCTQYHPYSIHAQLTIICSADTAAPTQSQPSVAPIGTTKYPSETPTLSPTFAPTNAPTESPSPAPVASPTMAPSFSPVLRPTSAPSFSPVFHPTGAPSVAPSEPTPSPIKIVAPYVPNPTFSPSLDKESTHGRSSTDADAEDAGNLDDDGYFIIKYKVFMPVLGGIVLCFCICCVVVVVLYYQRRKTLKKRMQKESELEELSPRVAIEESAPDETDPPPQHERVATFTSCASSDYHVMDGLMLSPMAMGDEMIILSYVPELPKESLTVGEKAVGEDDHEDLYSVPEPQDQTKQMTQDTDDDSDGDDGAYDRIYERHLPETGSTAGESEDDSDDDDDESSQLYHKPNNQTTPAGGLSPKNNYNDVDIGYLK